MFQRGGTGILPERGSQQQYDMVMQLLQSGMAGAQNSGSPLLAFLAPMLGGAIGTRTSNLRNMSAESGGDELTASLLGNNAEARKYSEMLSDPNLPPHLKNLAQTMMTDALKPKVPLPGVSPRRGSSTRTSGASPAGAAPTAPTSLGDLTNDQLWAMAQNKRLPASQRNLASRLAYDRVTGARSVPGIPGAEVPTVPLAKPNQTATPALPENDPLGIR